MAAFILFTITKGHSQGSVEQYCYVGKNIATTWVPVLRWKGSRNWYTEARYNYEDINTFSFYAGRMFYNQGKVLYSATPTIGGVFGKLKGVSAGLNLTLDYGNFFFSSQSQYTMTSMHEEPNFFFSWSELGYQPKPWIYFGISAQNTYFKSETHSIVEIGGLVGFQTGKWTFPIYVFNPAAEGRYFVLGVNFAVVHEFKRRRKDN